MLGYAKIMDVIKNVKINQDMLSQDYIFSFLSQKYSTNLSIPNNPLYQFPFSINEVYLK